MIYKMILKVTLMTQAKKKLQLKESLLGLLELDMYLLSQYEIYIKDIDSIDMDIFNDVSNNLLKIQNYIKFTLTDIDL